MRPVWGTPYNSGDDYSSSSVELLRRSGAQGNEGGAIDNGALPHRAYRSPGISFAHGSGWAGHDWRDTNFYFQGGAGGKLYSPLGG